MHESLTRARTRLLGVSLLLGLFACGGSEPSAVAPGNSSSRSAGSTIDLATYPLEATDRKDIEDSVATITALVGHPVAVRIEAAVVDDFGPRFGRSLVSAYASLKGHLLRHSDRDLSGFQQIVVRKKTGSETNISYENGTLDIAHTDTHEAIFGFSASVFDDAFPSVARGAAEREFANSDPTAIPAKRRGAYLAWLASGDDRLGHAALAARFGEKERGTAFEALAGHAVVRGFSALRDVDAQSATAETALPPILTYLAHAQNLDDNDQDELLRFLAIPSKLPALEAALPALLEPLAARALVRERAPLLAYARSPEAARSFGRRFAALPDPIPLVRENRSGDAKVRSKADATRLIVEEFRRSRSADASLFAFLDGVSGDPKSLHGTLVALGERGPQSSVGWVPAYKQLWNAHPEQQGAILLALAGLPEDGIADPFKDFKLFAPTVDRAGFLLFLREGAAAVRALPRAWPAFAVGAPSGEALLEAMPAYFSDGRSEASALRKIRQRLCNGKQFRELGLLYEGFKKHNTPGEDPRWERYAPEIDPRSCASGSGDLRDPFSDR